MTEPATWLVGITHRQSDDDSTAYVALALGYGPRIDLPPSAARQVARQLLLCADDAEQFNNPEKDKEEA
jgi:hypothetical protein